jgi:putative transposase
MRAATAATRQLALCCELYNAALQERRDAYRLQGLSLTAATQSKQLPEIKAVRSDVAAVGSQVLQDVLQRLDRAYQAFFRRVKAGQTPGFPRFRSSRRYDSLTFKQAGWALGPVAPSGKKRTLTLHGIGTVKLFWSREITGRIKTVTLKRDACGDWFVTFSCDQVPPRELDVSDAVGAIDVGLEAMLTESDGSREENMRPAKSAQARIARRQRIASKRKKGGKRRRKAVRILARAHRRIERVRKDWHHKVALKLVRKYGMLAVEDLDVKGMARGMFARAVNDVAWGQFLQILADKAASAGRTLILVDPRGTSQECSACGSTPEVPKVLSERWHRCACGYEAHRDENAALNILARGLDTWLADVAEPVLELHSCNTGRAGPSASSPALKAAA